MKNVAIVGFGFMGMTHAVNVLKNKNLKLVAIVDRDIKGIEEKITSKTGNFSTEALNPNIISSVHKYQNIDECIAKEELDAVHICVHTDLHYELTKKTLLAGLNVFLEKPMTLDISQGMELIELSRKFKRTLMVGHVVRFISPYKKLKKWTDEKTYGPLKFLSMSRYSGVPNWGQWKEKQRAFGSSGGALFDLLIHDIDFVQYLLGEPDDIESRYLPGALSEHDYISAFWDYHKPGIRVKLEGGNTFHSTFPFQAGYMVNFENASVLYTTLKPDIIQLSDNDKTEEIPAEDGSDGYFDEIDYFYTCIERGKDPEQCLPESSLETIRLCYKHLE